MSVRLLTRAGLALLATALLAACYPRFQALPSGTPVQSEELAGFWHNAGLQDPAVRMTVTLDQPNGTFTAVLREKGDSPAGDDLTFKGTALESGGVKYVALRDAKDPEGIGMMLFRYEVADNHLTVTPASEEALKTAIGSGLIAGEVQGEGPGAEITVSADAIALAAFLATPKGAAVFDIPAENRIAFVRAGPGSD